MGEQQGLLEETFDLVSTPAADSMGMPAGDGTPAWEMWELCAGLDSCQESSPPLHSRGHHGLTNPLTTAFHGTNASPSLPKTRSTYYSLLLK